MNKVVKQSPPMTKRMLRFVRNLFWAVVILLIGIVALLFSGIGNQVLVYSANHLVPNLAIETDGKPLLRGGKFSVNYHNTQIKLNLKNMVLDLRFYSCAALCFEELSADLVDIALTGDTKQPANTDETELSKIYLPLSIAVNTFSVKQITFSQGQLNASISDVFTRLKLRENELNIAKITAGKIDIGLAQAEQNTASVSSAKTITLPEISPIYFATPLNWQIGELAISQFKLQQGDTSQLIKNIYLQAGQHNSDITIAKLSLAYQDLRAKLEGRVSLSGNNPVKVALQVNNKEHQIETTISGDLAKLRLKSELTGLYHAKLDASASLLEKQLPFNLSIESDALSISEQAQQITVQNSIIKADGNLSAFRYQLKTNATLSGLPKMMIESDGEGSLSEIDIDRFLIKTAKSNLALTGNLSWQQGIEASLFLLSDKISVEEFEPTVASDIALKGAVDFISDGINWQLNVPQFSLAGYVNNAPIDANIVLVIDDKLHAEIEEFTISSVDNQLTLSGDINNNWNVSGNLNLVNPETIDSRLSGQGKADFNITGELKAPFVNWTMALNQLAFQEYRIDKIISSGTLDFAKNYLANISLEAAGISLDEQSISKIVLNTFGDLQKHDVKLQLHSETLNMTSIIEGGLNAERYRGQIKQLALKNDKIDLSNQQAIEFDYDLNTGLTNVSEHCWSGTNSAFCLEAITASAEKGNVDLALTHFDLSVLSLVLPNTISPSGEITGHLNARWQDAKLLSIDSELQSNDINFGVDESFINTNVPIEQLFFKVNVNESAIALDTTIKSSVLGNIIGDIDIIDVSGKRPLKGKLALQALNFTNFKGFSQQIDKLAGELNADVTLGGSAFSPQVQGQLNLSDFAFLAPWTPVSIEQGNLNVTFDDDSATLSGKLFDHNQGNIAIEGNADWQQEPSFNARINGDAFKIALEPNLWFAISPNIEINYAQQFADVKGQVHVVDGRVKVKELPEGAVSVSDDELIIDAAKQQKKSVPIAYSLDLAILIDDKVRIDSFGLRSKLQGDVLFKQVDNTPLIATGEIALLEGEYRAFGQELLIETGQLIFNGPVDRPLLNVRAIRNPDLTEDGVTAGVKLTGNVEEPRLDVFSDPNMDQAMALSYLLSGRALSESNSASDGMLTQLLLARGLARGEGSISKIGEAFGIDDVSLSSRGSGEETKVEISGYVAPGIQVRYSIGIFDSMSEVAVRYQLLPKLYIEAISGINDSLDILYKFDWD